LFYGFLGIENMKILSGEEFFKMPYGTLYINFVPETFTGSLKIKSEFRSDTSWWATDILPWGQEGEFYKIKNYSGNDEIKTEGFCTDDAIYNHKNDMLWAVFDKNEIKEMIERLIETL
jgi:hypothetical protein